MNFTDLTKAISATRSDNIGHAIEDMVSQAIMQRRNHERRWYDNNYFDDGLHFRVVSRKTGRVIDTIDRANGYVERAIPRASRQIRGVANLLFAAEPYPVVYPQRTSVSFFKKPDGSIDEEAYRANIDKNKDIARKKGVWLSTQWEDQDLELKMIDALLLAFKNAISYVQVYTDPLTRKIRTDVFDAFDVIVFGDRRDTQSLPFMTKTAPMDLTDIQQSPIFEPSMVAKLTPDNKYATSEIKDAYMRARYGTKIVEKGMQSLIVKETFMKTVLTGNNWKDTIKKAKDGAMEGKSPGDVIMRHVFSAGGVTLKDEYIDYDKYPLIPVRYEPGPLYQVPLIERFIPQNKSLDVTVTRLEKFVNSMVVGVYQKRKGENFQVNNFPGGQMVEYETTPLSQMNVTNPGNAPFNIIELMNKYIEEQGASTSTGGQLPTGVKSGVAIESIKATEYANLKVSTLMLKNSIKEIAECMLERASKEYLEPEEVEYMDDGEPDYFDVIGKKGYELSMQVGKELPEDTIVLDKDSKIRIEIEPGMGMTMDGKKQAMQQIIDYMLKLTELQVINPEALKMVIKKFLDTFGFGSTQEFMELMDEGMTQGELDDQQIMKLKIALAETLEETGAVGKEADDRLVESTKIGVAEALNDLDMVNKEEQPAVKPPSESISFKDMPVEGKVQMAAKAGIEITPQDVQKKELQDKVVKQIDKNNQKSDNIAK